MKIILMIVFNFKTYREASGKKAVEIARLCEKYSKKYKVKIGVAPQFLDIPLVKKNSKVIVFSQHVDPVISGRYTGSISFDSLIKHGIKYSLLNHSEKKVSIDTIKKVFEISRKLKFNLFILASSIEEARKIAKLNPWGIGFEPPELIGTGRSVSKTEPEVVKKFVKIVRSANKKSKLFCGAGITNGEDVKVALELGVDGVLVASAFVKSKSKEKLLKEFLKAFK